MIKDLIEDIGNHIADMLDTLPNENSTIAAFHLGYIDAQFQALKNILKQQEQYGNQNHGS
jgi:alkylation response protein AidB-like acyl-CoA dehydrogenase